MSSLRLSTTRPMHVSFGPVQGRPLGRSRRNAASKVERQRKSTYCIAEPSEKLESLRVRAQKVNQRLNEKLWQDRLRSPETEHMVSMKEALGACSWNPTAHHREKAQMWAKIQEEAKTAAAEEPVLASFFHMTVIMHRSMEKSMAFLLSNKLSSPTLLGIQLTRLILEAYEDEPSLIEACVADLNAVFERSSL